MQVKVLHEIIDIMHGRGMIGADKHAELHAELEADGAPSVSRETVPVSPPKTTPPARVPSGPEAS